LSHLDEDQLSTALKAAFSTASGGGFHVSGNESMHGDTQFLESSVMSLWFLLFFLFLISTNKSHMTSGGSACG